MTRRARAVDLAAASDALDLEHLAESKLAAAPSSLSLLAAARRDPAATAEGAQQG